MLKLYEKDPSYVDLSEVIEETMPWSEVREKLRPHPLNRVKSLLKYYSIINRTKLYPLLSSFEFPSIYVLDECRKEFRVHLGILYETLEQLGIENSCEYDIPTLRQQARKSCKKLGNRDKLARAGEGLLEFSKNFILPTDCEIDSLFFEEMMDHEDPIEKLMNLPDYLQQMTLDIVYTAYHLIETELEIRSRE